MDAFKTIFIGHKVLILLVAWFGIFIILTWFLNTFADLNGLAVTIPLFSFAGIFGIAALSLNLEVGLAGMPNFGKIAFFMVGAYTTGTFTLLGFPIHYALIIGMIVTGFLGYLIALPTLKLRADYLAIVTIAIGEILRTIILAEQWLGDQLGCLCGGARGLRVQNIFREGILYDVVIGGNLIQRTVVADFLFLIAITITMFVVYLILETLYNSPWGRILKSIRDNDIATESLGKDVVDYRIRTFIIASAFAGLAGGIFGIYIVTISPFAFLPLLTFQIWIMMILGGIANNRGVIFGSVLFWSITNLTLVLKEEVSAMLSSIASLLNPFNDLPFIPTIQGFIIFDPINLQNFGFGLILLLFLLFRPQGVIPEREIKTVAKDVMIPIPTD